MARLPKNPTQAVAELGVPAGSRVLTFGPANGYVEALSEAVGESGRVRVWDPPPELAPAGNVEVVENVAEDEQADVVLVWLGPVPGHSIREYPARVSDGGSFWVVFPRRGRDAPSPVHEADVKRALLVTGWREERVLPLSTDWAAVRFRPRK